jgi:hypothetical protein
MMRFKMTRMRTISPEVEEPDSDDDEEEEFS